MKKLRKFWFFKKLCFNSFIIILLLCHFNIYAQNDEKLKSISSIDTINVNYKNIVLKLTRNHDIAKQLDKIRSIVISVNRNTDYEIKNLFENPTDYLLKLKENGESLSKNTLPDLTKYYRLIIENVTAQQSIEIFNEIINSKITEVIYYTHKNMAPPPITPDFSSYQDYLSAAPVGVNAIYAWTFNGSNGENIKFCDVECAINFNHEEFTNDTITVVSSSLYPYNIYKDHGTAVCGIVFGEHNGTGINGIADKVDPYISYMCLDPSCNSWGFEQAIINATTVLGYGDVMLIELQSQHPFGAPIEIEQTVFDAILTATSNGIIVVEAAGNGANNLDDTLTFGHIFNINFRNSGAIIIGASSLNNSRIGFSSYGNRIDLFSQGEATYTSGYGDLYNNSINNNSDYTAEFGGTSGASAIIAGTVACYQGIYYAQFGSKLSPMMMRDLLYNTGTPSLNSTDKIGRKPNLAAALNVLSADYNFLNKTSPLLIYPNPINDIATIYIDDFSKYKNHSLLLVFYDLMGKEVMRIEQISENDIQLHKNEIGSGMFFYKLISDNLIICSGKIIVN